MTIIIDLSYLDEIRDICDSADDKPVIEAYKYYKPREKQLGKKEQIYLKMLEKEIKERNIKIESESEE